MSIAGNILTAETYSTGEDTDTRIYLYNNKLKKLAFNFNGGTGFFSYLIYDLSKTKAALSEQDRSIESATLTIYPNPANGKFFLELDYELDADAILEIIDVNGRVIMQQIIPENTFLTNEFDISNYSDGIYFIRIIHYSGVKTGKLIIQ